MSRTDPKGNSKASGRQGGATRKKSFARGNAPIVKKNIKHKATTDSIRLNRYIANSGACSRREADIFIAAGSVSVNDKPITEMGYRVKLTDCVKFDGRIINPVKMEYIVLNKPKDFVTVSKDDRGRRNTANLISNASKSLLKPVLKLDKEALGILLYTNDNELINKLAKPKNGIRKIYQIELSKPLEFSDLKKLREGITIDNYPVSIKSVDYVENAPKSHIGIEIWSSRYNILKKIFTHLEYEIVKNDLVLFATVTKKDLPRGHWRKLTDLEISNLKMIQ